MNIKSLALTGLLAGSMYTMPVQAFETMLPKPHATLSGHISEVGPATFRIYRTRSCIQTRIRGSVHTNYSCHGVGVATLSRWPSEVLFYVDNSSPDRPASFYTTRAGYGKYSIEAVALDGGSSRYATGTCTVTHNTISCFAILVDGRRVSFNSVLR